MVRGITKYILSGIKDKAKPLLSWLPYNWRHGSDYRQWRAFLKEAQYYSYDQIAQWQLENMKKIVDYAYKNTKGYRQLYDAHHVHPGDIQKLSDIKHFPFVTKQLLQDNLEEFSVPGHVRFYVTTGGSTGIPFGFYCLYKNSEIEDAFIHAVWSIFGWVPNEYNAILRGAYIGNEESIWSMDKFRKELLLSTYYLSWNTLDLYIDVISHFKPKVLQAYPSSLNILCDLLMDAKKVGSIDFDLIILASENVYDWMLAKYKRTFPNSRFVSFYGHAERVILAPWCEYTQYYHLIPFYGYTEILNEDGVEADEDGQGELVGTGFHMKATPFIRYKTMDHVIKGQSHCSACGRSYQLLNKIVGRSHEVIVTKTDRLISMTAINMHSSVFDDVRQFQFYQDTPGRLDFRIVPKPSCSAQSIDNIYSELMKKLGDDTELTITQVDEIPKTKAGKFRFLDQRLSIKYHDMNYEY